MSVRNKRKHLFVIVTQRDAFQPPSEISLLLEITVFIWSWCEIRLHFVEHKLL